ncbi:MAG TPA: stage III sporulation protein SpoIIIAB [Chondromyces sp.]|nr:stage III sporulation protein SpoIIIAB [Chondromyces sp.]
MKWIGAFIILLASVLFGFERAKQLSNRPKQLRVLRSALQSLETEMLYGHTPLHEAARKLSSQLPMPANRLFSVFSETLTSTETTVRAAWETALLTVWPDTALKPPEFEILRQFGQNLGKHDLLTEQKQILLAIQHLEREEEEARERQRQYERMAKSLSILGGLLVIILLI